MLVSGHKEFCPLGSYFEKLFYTTKFLGLVLYDERQGFMRKTAVYLFIALSMLSLGLTLIPNVSSQTQNIKILCYTYYVDNQGYLDVVGEVQNIGANTVSPVFLTGAIYSPSGVDISPSYCQVWQLYLAPQQKAPFYMEFQAPQSTGVWQLSDIGNITLTPSIANATNSYQYSDFKVIDHSAAVGTSGDLNGAYMVSGTIQNVGTQTAYNITMAATFYNATGTVVAVGNTYTPSDPWITGSLAPSATVDFQVGAFDLNQTIIPAWEKISSYSLIVQATAPVLQGTAVADNYQSTGASSSSSGSSPTTTSSAQATAKSKNSSIDTTIYVIVIAVVILAVAVAVAPLVSRRSKPHETVKEAKKARKKSVTDILPLPLAFFSKQSTLSLRNMSLFKYFLRTLIVYGL